LPLAWRPVFGTPDPETFGAAGSLLESPSSRYHLVLSQSKEGCALQGRGSTSLPRGGCKLPVGDLFLNL
jgi:hypothetical protein